MAGQPKRQTVPIDSIIGNPRNDNLHPQSQIDLLVESIKKFGQPRPILVRGENRMIIAGHGVWQAMQQAGEDDIDVLLWDVDQKTADAYLVADNRFSELSKPDVARRRDLLEEMEEADYAALGFMPADIDALLGASDTLAVREVETTEVADRFWISVRGPLQQQAQALKRIQELMADLPAVEVDLGTVTSII